MVQTNTPFIDRILELKQKCRIAEEIRNGHDLTAREIGFLFCINENGPMSSARLSECMDLSPSRGSRIIGRLIAKGYLQKVKDPSDKRCLTLSITNYGAQCLRSIETQKEACENALERKLSLEDRDIVDRALDRLLQIL